VQTNKKLDETYTNRDAGDQMMLTTLQGYQHHEPAWIRTDFLSEQCQMTDLDETAVWWAAGRKQMTACKMLTQDSR